MDSKHFPGPTVWLVVLFTFNYEFRDVYFGHKKRRGTVNYNFIPGNWPGYDYFWRLIFELLYKSLTINRSRWYWRNGRRNTMGISYLTSIFFVSSSTTDNTAAATNNETGDIKFRTSNLQNIQTSNPVLFEIFTISISARPWHIWRISKSLFCRYWIFSKALRF